jgi:ABC-type sugar transport system ATPase subunit
MKAAARDGCAVLFYSSDIDELIDLADRVVVVRDGSIIGVDRTAEAIGNALFRSPSSSQGRS